MAAADYVGFTDAIKAKFVKDLANEEENPTVDVAQWLRRCNEWADGTYPRGLTYSDLRWMAEQCVAELHRRDPKSDASMDGFPAAAQGKEAAGPQEKKSGETGAERRCRAGSAALAAASETRSSAPSLGRKKRRHRSAQAIKREFRHIQKPLEVRAAEDGSDGIVLVGTPIVYNTPYTVRDMYGEFEETMLPGVASRVIANGADVRFLFNHDGMPLARTVNGTLRLADTATGLEIRAVLDPRSQIANDLAVAVERGDVSEMSCGFVVASDTWSDDFTQRSIAQFEQLFDVSAVTYPASPTTNVEMALRSLLCEPLESNARRRLIAVEHDLRAGRVLSAENHALVQTVFDAASKVLANADSESDDTDEDAGDATVEPDSAVLASRSTAPATTDERRAAVGSFNDTQRALYTALQTAFGGDDGDECFDLWIEDFGTDWVVWNAYGDAGPGIGTWRAGYTADGDGTVTLTGEPVQVTIETNYVPVQRSENPEPDSRALVALELEAEQLRLRGRRHHAA